MDKPTGRFDFSWRGKPRPFFGYDFEKPKIERDTIALTPYC